MTNTIREIVTPTRLALLELLDKGPAERRGQTSYYCRKLGWTQWEYRNEVTGQVAPEDEVFSAYSGNAKSPGVAMWDAGWRISGREMLTDKGREVLAAARAAAKER